MKESMIINTWVLVANASEARLYQTTKIGNELNLIKAFEHVASREKDGDLVSDNLGRFNAKDKTQGSFAEQTDPKQHEANLFAQELVAALEAGRTANQYDRLVVMASPHFHGLLNKHCNDHVSKLITNNVNKDYTKLSDRELNDIVAELPRF